MAANGTDNAAQVRDIMLTMTADRDLLRTLAMNYGEMSNDQPLMEELAQSPDFGIELLGGQNYIGVLSDVAATVDLSNISSYEAATSQVPPQKKLWGLGQTAQSWAAAVSFTLGAIHTSRPQAGRKKQNTLSATPGWWAAACFGRKPL